MQIHEITKKNTNLQLEEAVGDAVGAGIGRAVSGAKNVASFVTKPFKDIAQGYKTARLDQNTAAVADKFQRAWQQYSVSWAKSQDGTYTAPGKAPAAATGSATPGATQPTTAPAAAATAQDLFGTVQALDDTQLAAVAKILKQRVGPKATMNALKTTPVNEVSYQDIRSGVQRAATGVANVAKAGVQAVKAAPGAIARAAGGTAGAIAGMPGAAGTAYRGAKARTAGPAMTPAELQRALTALSVPQAQELYSFVTQIQQARKAGLREGVNPPALLPSYEQALKAFVQKNMLAGMQYSRLQNVAQIDDLIKQMVEPANDTAAKQKELWQKLTLASTVAQQNPAGSGTPADQATDPNKTPGTGGGTEDAETLKQPVAQSLGKNLQAAAAAGAEIRSKYTNNATSIGSTGVPAVDAMLMNMGFNPA